jgi:hypothetical protein
VRPAYLACVINAAGYGNGRANVGVMDTNNVRSGNLGMVVLAVVPILIYMVVWLVLPWIAKG